MNYTAETFKREPLLVEYYSQTRGPLQLQFPPLEDANSIQVALSMLLTALGQDRIEARRATTMLYNLQVASSNARHLTHNERCVVTDTVSDDAGNLLSPDEDPQEVIESQLFLSNLDPASSSDTDEDPDDEDNGEDESDEDDDYEDEEGDDYEDEDEDDAEYEDEDDYEDGNGNEDD